MVDLKIIFKFIDKICLAEDSPSNSNGKKINVEDIPGYIFELREEPGQLTPEKVQDLLIYEGIEKKYIQYHQLKYISTDDIEYISFLFLHILKDLGLFLVLIDPVLLLIQRYNQEYLQHLSFCHCYLRANPRLNKFYQ